MVLDTPLAETQLETLDFNTEPVDDSYCIEDVRIQPICEYEKNVVLDSEDDEFHKTKAGNATNGLSFNRTYIRRVKRNALGLLKRLSSLRCAQMEDRASDFDASAAKKCAVGIKGYLVNNTECKDGGEALPQLDSCENNLAGLDYVSSQEEPGESLITDALDFINHFLSSSDLDLSPAIDPRNTVREKSPFVSSAKGSQNLAKRIKFRAPVTKTGTYEWTDSDQQEGGNFYNKRMEASSDIKGFGQRPGTRHQKATHFDRKGDSSTESDFKEKKDFIKPQGNITYLTHSVSTFVEHSPKEICKMEQVSEMKLESNSVRESDEHLHAELSEQKLEASLNEGDALELIDVGINTQIAAEAMEALLNAPPPSYSIGDACLNLHNTLKDSPIGVANAKGHTKQALAQKSTCNSGGTARKTRKRTGPARKFSLTSSSSWQHSKNQGSITTKAKGGGLLSDGQLICRNLAYKNGSSGGSFNPIEQRKAKGAVGVNKVENNKDCVSSSTLVKHILPGDANLLDQHVGHRSRQWMSGDRLEAARDQSDNIRERKNDVTEGGLRTYKRKRKHLVVNPCEVLSAKEKCLEFSFKAPQESRNSRWEQQEQIGLQLASITSGLKSDAWSYPRGKRSRRKLQSHSTLACNMSSPLATVDGKESITHSSVSQRSLETKNVELCAMDCTIAVNCTEGLDVESANLMADKYHRKPCNQNLPKSYLLKELIRLGIPESIPDSAWKNLRRRRNIAYVRVLFSQHLDDDIIKQQKKILARLGIFIASCSTDATHFIADRFVRTRNMLEAIALGKPVVTPLWLESCGQAGCLIDEKNYILRDAKKEKEIGFSMPVSLAHASQHPLLKQGHGVFITPNIKPDREMISSLVKTVHGQVVEQNQIPLGRDQKFPDDLLILSCEEDKAICVPFLKKGAAVYSSEFLLNGIVIHKLEYVRHQLFINGVKSSRANSRSRRCYIEEVHAKEKFSP
ncbi:hypothetical protein CFOL_v3_22538 [Cephalotus follicularis]|uniref:BRCT domain-containing protein n=1 Tax=Cephalotus follicularis TaxID=3775 RepID=A0A1Q3CG67_CEPFO|nr:hypothetical protein CFOL_v3_22538 [Cephalotus follicularis]